MASTRVVEGACWHLESRAFFVIIFRKNSAVNSRSQQVRFAVFEW